MRAGICLVGRIVVAVDGQEVDERSLPGGQARLVLALLVCERQRPVTRDELADELWPVVRPHTWETALRGVVGRVRAFLVSAGLGGPEVVSATSGAYSMRLPDDLEVDIERALSDACEAERVLLGGDAAGAAQLAARARATLSRPLLPGVDGPWLDGKRRQLSQLLLQALETLSEARLACHEYGHAATVAEEAIALDPFRESAHRLLMRAHIVTGNGAAGLWAYERCRRLLSDELGVDPSPETRGLYGALLGSGSATEPVAPVASPPAPSPPSDVCPYRGLQTFEESDAPHFFGRSADVSRLLQRLERGRFLAVLGPSGSGKSSLVRAGLIPALRRGALPGSDTWLFCVMRPGALPLKTLAGELALLDASIDQGTVRQLIDDDQVLGRLLEGTRADAARVVLVVDQLEEAFTLCADEEQRRALFDGMAVAATAPHGRVVVIVTMRADFYPRLADHPRLADLASSHQFLVTPMDEVGLTEAIVAPARSVGLRVEEGLTETIVRDVARRPGALPLLGHCLLEVWERRGDGALTLAGYRDSGGVERALAHRAESVYLSLSAEQRAILRRVLLRLTHPGAGSEDTRRRALFSELPTEPAELEILEVLVERLTEARLLTTGGPPAEDRWVEVSHEALIRGWPRLKNWVDEDRAGLLVHRRLTAAAGEWERLGRDDGALYRGAKLAEAAAWAERDPQAPNPLERRFLEASLASEQALERRRLRRLRLIAASSAVALVAVGTLGMVAGRERDRAIQQQRLAMSRELAAAAVAQLAVEPGLGLRLAVEAVELARTREAVASLRQALVTPTPRLQLPGGRGDFALDAGGSHVAVLHLDGRIRVWDQDGDLIHSLQDDSGSGFRAAFSPDGSLLLTTHRGAVRIWDVEDGSLIRHLPHGSGLTAAAWSPDGRRVVVTANSEAAIRVWDVVHGGEEIAIRPPVAATFVEWSPDGEAVLAWSASDPHLFVFDAVTGRQLAVLSHDAPAVGAVVAPDGRYALSVGFDGTARIWELPAGAEVAVLEGFSDWVWTGRFSPDATLVVIGDESGKVRFAEVPTGRTRFELTAHDASVIDAAFSPDGRLAATASVDGTVVVWDTSTGQPIGTLKLDGSVAPDLGVSSVIFSPDGKRIFTLAASVEVWDTPPGPSAVLGAHDGRVSTLAFSRDGTLLATGGYEGILHVWDHRAARILRTLRVPDSAFHEASFNPDGSLLVTANPFSIVLADRDIPPTVWEAATGRRIRSLAVPAPSRPPCYKVCQTHAAAFSPDGEMIMTAGQEGMVRLWDTATGDLLRSLEGIDRRLFAATFSPDGRWLAGTTLDSVPIWDVRTGQLVRVLDAPGVDVAFSPGGDVLAVAGDDGMASLWEVATGRAQVQLRHSAAVEAVAWSPTGRFLLTGTSDGFGLWDAASQQRIQEFTGAGGPAAFAPDGSIVTGRIDGTVHFYQCQVCGSVEALLEAARSRGARGLTPAERQRFLQGPAR